MNRNYAFVLALASLMILCMVPVKPVGASGDSWTEKASMLTPRGGLGVAVVDGKIYAIGGDNINGLYDFSVGFTYSGFNGGVLSTNEEYDPATNTWTSKTSMPTPRSSFAIAAYEGKIYCIGGRAKLPVITPATLTTVNEVYDPATNTWETKASMPTAIQSPFQASVVNEKIYVMDGSGANYAYDPATDSWATKAHLANGWSEGFVSAVIDNQVYVIGGILDRGYHFIYDPSTDSWNYSYTPTPPFGGGGGLWGLRGDGAAGATTGMMAPKRMYVFFENQVYVYDPVGNNWTSGAALQRDFVNFGVAVLNDTFYVIGGGKYPQVPVDYYAPTAANEQYTPIGYGTPDPTYDGTPPEITLISPENKTYYNASIPLEFSANEPLSSMYYKLDNGTIVEISGNTTITGLSLGSHNLTVYATDEADNTGDSQMIYFTIEETEPVTFSVVLVAAVSVAVVMAGVGLLVYFKKRKR